MTADLLPLLQRPQVLIAAAVVAALVLFWVARRVRKLARTERPDEPLSNLAMLLGLGWSSEAIWVITKDMPMGPRVALFCVLEVFLTLSMIRAKQHFKMYGWPGRPGQTVWGIASVMSVIAVFAAASTGEALLRVVIPVALAKLWWDGLVGGQKRPAGQVSSWRWTPRRLLLWLGALEPGERDVETVHRERLTQQMTRLEFARRHGREKSRERCAARLSRLSLTADDEVIAEVRRRVERSTWFEATQDEGAVEAPRVSILAGVAASARARRVRHGRALRRVHVTHPRPVVVAAQDTRQDERETHERDLVIRVIKQAEPGLKLAQIARLAVTSEPTVRRALRRTSAQEPTQINGRTPELAAVGANEKES